MWKDTRTGVEIDPSLRRVYAGSQLFQVPMYFDPRGNGPQLDMITSTGSDASDLMNLSNLNVAGYNKNSYGPFHVYLKQGKPAGLR
eukprot:tig00020603_g11771.t1